MRAEQLLSLFPRGWRERYGDEFLATAGDEPLRLGQVIDIAACAVDAWVSPEVRHATRAVRAQTAPGENLMSKKLMTSCGSTALELSRREAMIAALAMIGGSLFLAIAGIVAKRTGLEAIGDSLVTIAFPASLFLAMPFTYLKGKSWRTQLVLVVLPLLLLVSAGILAHFI
jgi:hypothetical protein